MIPKFQVVHPPPDEMFCCGPFGAGCGKRGHTYENCWMRLKSSIELGLTTLQDLALNDFLFSLPKLPAFKP